MDYTYADFVIGNTIHQSTNRHTRIVLSAYPISDTPTHQCGAGVASAGVLARLIDAGARSICLRREVRKQPRANSRAG